LNFLVKNTNLKCNLGIVFGVFLKGILEVILFLGFYEEIN
jgi:hypothetical protein